ncbi:D-alanine--D-alanine ligase [Patescibacteria group bacterium]
MSKTRIGVLRGGVGHEYDVSLQTGANVLKHLPQKYSKEDILITKDGTWHIGGVPVSIEEASRKVDIIFNCLHGEYGEDGGVQKELNRFAIPYTGSKVLASVFAMNKPIAKDIAKKAGILTPNFVRVEANEDVNQKTHDIFHSMSFPLIVKPARLGSSVGVSFVKKYDELTEAIHKALSVSDSILVEEYVKGREATCAIIEKFRNEDVYSLPVVEIQTPDGDNIFDKELKYNGKARKICPGNFNKDEKKQIIEAAKKMHKALDLKHYSRSDFILSPRGIYFLETNSLPGLTEESLLPKALDAVGSNLSEFLDHIVALTLEGK